MTNEPELLSALRDPRFYPHSPAEVTVLETHISWVFLAGDLVYKCKKPVRFDFLDFSTLESRKRACDDEVRLNRRLAPETYLGVVPVTRGSCGLQIGGDGPAVEWLVQMRRLPIQQTLDQRLWRGNVQQADVSRLADLLRPFFRNQPPVPVTVAAYRDRLIAQVQQNRRELLATAHHLPAEVIQRVHAAQLQLLHRRRDCFDERVIAGRIIEGHGDLRPEHICFAERPIIFDCLEFSSDLRTLDVADELAFLAMECDYLGARWIGVQLLGELRPEIGEQLPDWLIGFYKSYRACVRAKVAALRAEQLGGVLREAALCQARNYLLLADHYLQNFTQPLLIVVGGLSGTGKSSLALALGEALGAEILRTDVIRRTIFPAASAATVHGGAYQPAARERVYEALLREADRALAARQAIVLDATFADARQLRAAYALAQRAAVLFLAVECDCPAEIALERIRTRAAAAADASHADELVYRDQRANRQPWPADIPQERVTTTQSLAASTQQVIRALAG